MISNSTVRYQAKERQLLPHRDQLLAFSFQSLTRW